MIQPLRYLSKRVHEGVNYRLRSFAGGRWASHCRPVSIVFALTELCNARCVHCDIWKNRGKEDAPSLEQYKSVLTDLRTWLGPVQVVFSGGEALLKPYTPELVAHGSSIGLFLEVLTHGYWDDQSRIERLALARPWRLTVSLDGIGETHTKVRGRDQFFEKTTRSIETLRRVRAEQKLDYTIRLKNVIMAHNLDDTCEVARFANRDGMEIFFQPIEQNYNTPEDSKWFEHSDNWPRDTEKAIAVVRQLIAYKKQGWHIANSYEQLETMIPYFENPDSMRVSVQSHSAHERRALCSALTTLDFRANGDVVACFGQAPIGNIKKTPIREIWENRPHWWDSECCLERRCSDAEKEQMSLVSIA
jgi:MoaA/NifB/PqqE/SkfB family radical SAM enzyme